ncbi:hypothetical protein VIGAN_10164900 [Vigna angularis var. angularis]|uniref:Uncharacterized protein n=1 Tax=Vigna angularis var. angularis TaxID=157739 RepID=A0A0S3T5C4_PHAAN|nr:hypothetical protein VIGAN_10164900 [Vigna angularis var. angularis]
MVYWKIKVHLLVLTLFFHFCSVSLNLTCAAVTFSEVSPAGKFMTDDLDANSNIQSSRFNVWEADDLVNQKLIY